MNNNEKAREQERRDHHEKTKAVSYEDKRRYVRIARTMREKKKSWPEIEKKLKRSWRWIYKLVKEDDARIAAKKTSELRSDAGRKGAEAKWGSKTGKAKMKEKIGEQRKAKRKARKQAAKQLELPEEERPLNAVGYVRVSTEEQATHGLSLDVQERKIKAWCEAKDWKLIKIFRDGGYSGKSLKRPAVEEMLATIQDSGEIDAVVVFKLDRFTRSLRDLLNIIYGEFEKHNIVFSSVMESFDTGTSSGRMMLAILGASSQFEREVTGDRVSATKQDQKSRGEFVGTGTIAYKRIDNRLVLQPRGFEFIRILLKEWKKETPGRAIARLLNDKFPEIGTNKTTVKRIGERWDSIEEYKAYYEQWTESCKRPGNNQQ